MISEFLPGKARFCAGSRPSEQDGMELDDMIMSGQMSTFSTPEMLEPGDIRALEQGMATSPRLPDTLAGVA